MEYPLSFEQMSHYNTSKDGIAVGVTLTVGNLFTLCEAKVDTGAACCIFERALGENLGLDIERGLSQSIGTVTGSFVAYGHEVRLSVLGIEFETFVYFAADEIFTRNVLGRRGWLDRIKLGI